MTFFNPLFRAAWLLALVCSVGLASCDKDDDTEDPLPAPTGDFTFTQDATNPRMFQFTPTGVNESEIRVNWNFGHTDPGNTSSEFAPTTTFPSKPGETVVYKVSMTLTRRTGISDPTTITKDVPVTLPAERKLSPEEAILVGGTAPGSSKKWALGKNVKGHNRATTPTRFVWSRDPRQMECLGVYNDVYTFSFDGDSLHLEMDYGSDLYIRLNAPDRATRFPTGSYATFNEVCPSGTGLSSTGDAVVKNASNVRTTWSIGANAAGEKVLMVRDGKIHLDANQFNDYTFLTNVNGLVANGLQADSLWLRTYQRDSVIIWDMLLVPLAKVNEGGQPAGFSCTDNNISFDVNLLHGGSSKTWKYAEGVKGHSAALRPNGTFFWEREGSALACLGIYNDRYTFNADGTYSANFGGDIYTRNGLNGDSFTNVRSQADAGCAAGLSGNDQVAAYTSPSGLKYVGCNGGIRIEGGYLGLGVQQEFYMMERITADTMVVRAAQPDGNVIWQAILVPDK